MGYRPKMIEIIIIIIQIGKSFKYLGRYFNLSMDNNNDLSDVLHLVNNLMIQIDGIPGHPKIKPLLYDHFVLSRISWHFTIANLGNTRVTENMDNLVASYFRQWLELTISATFNTLIFFSFFSSGLC